MAKVKKNQKGGFPMMKLEIQGQYQELLAFNIKHDFFNSGNMPSGKVQLRPTDATVHVLTHDSLQYRGVPGGFMLGFGSSGGYTPIKEVSKPLQLTFFLDMDDVKFMNYTDLPYEFEEDKIFYFNNKGFEKDSTEDKNLSLDKYVTAEDKIEVSSSLINYDFEEEQYGVEVQVMNALEEIVWEQILDDGAVSCEISLVGQPEGKYSILVDGLEEKTFFVYNGLKSIFGVIDIFVDKDEFGDYSFFDDDGAMIKQEYNIRFGARSVRWQYLLIETGSESMHSDHEAYDASKKINFEAAEPAELESGKEIHTIWTEDAIPFKQSQRQKFKLKTKRGKSGVEWIVELPCASALGNLKVNLSDKSEVYSELIVYL